MNLNVDLDLSLGDDCEQGNLLFDASQVPGVIWEVCAFGLHVGHWSKLSSAERKFFVFFVEFKILNKVS